MVAPEPSEKYVFNVTAVPVEVTPVCAGIVPVKVGQLSLALGSSLEGCVGWSNVCVHTIVPSSMLL